MENRKYDIMRLTNELGVIYLAFGKPYLAMALRSIATLKEWNSSLPVCIITNVDFDAAKTGSLDNNRDSIIRLDELTSKNRDIKTNIVNYSPFKYSIFLDCDTLVMGDLSEAKLLLKYFDIAFRLNPYPQLRKGKGDVLILDNNPVCVFPHWNSGVILFKKGENTIHFFEEWNIIHKSLKLKYDQVSLVETIFKTNARVLSLGDKWNSVDPIIGRKKWLKHAKVFHYGTNISDVIVTGVIMEAQKVFSTAETLEVKKAILAKRNLKKKQGIFKYLAARVIWKFWSPV